MTEQDKKLEEYNSEPIYFCKECLSLKIMNLGGDQGFCDSCGCMDNDTCSIDEWNEMFEKKYNHKFIENGRKSTYRWSTDHRE